MISTQRIARVAGYGMTQAADAYVYRPTCVEEINKIFDEARTAGRKVTLRGAGRSYGDGNIGSETLLIDITRMNRILSWDASTGIIDCQSGVTIENIWRFCLEDGYWPPVVTGTMYPTLGGALGMNVHGKNNYCQGTMGEHVIDMDVLFPNGELKTLTKDDDLFYAVISSAGLLGVITRVKLQMHHVASGNVDVWAEAAQNWDEQFALFEKYEHNSDYMVSWVDCFAKGAKAGRGQFHGAWYKDREDLASRVAEKQDLPALILGFFPKSLVWKVLKLVCNRPGMRFLNAAKQFASSTIGNNKMHDQSLVAFSFLLDYVPDWRKAYEPGGFIQYQTFIPKEHAKAVFAEQVRLQQEYKLESFLGVLKRHRPDKFLFSHAVDGYSMALDFKVTAKNRVRLWELAHKMNDLTLKHGGRFYFAKDSTLRPEDAAEYLGEGLPKFRKLKSELDPEGLLVSDLGRRLKLS
jgi:decaprenylphospho-beta-D-ribofuranose 2-oxidase